MTGGQQDASMKGARIIETEILLPKPKKFVRELVEMPDGYRCDWYYVDTLDNSRTGRSRGSGALQ